MEISGPPHFEHLRDVLAGSQDAGKCGLSEPRSPPHCWEALMGFRRIYHRMCQLFCPMAPEREAKPGCGIDITFYILDMNKLKHTNSSNFVDEETMVQKR